MNLESFITTFSGDAHSVNTIGSSKQISLFYLFDALVVQGKNIQTLVSETPKDLLIEGLNSSYETASILEEYQYGDIVIWEDVPENITVAQGEGFLGIVVLDMGLSLSVFGIHEGIPQQVTVAKAGIARIYRMVSPPLNEEFSQETILISALLEIVSLFKVYQKQVIELFALAKMVPQEQSEFFALESSEAARRCEKALLHMDAEA
ncbi:MAG: hypothetical protein QM632_05600 [Micrococcaceae bacterium]